MEIYIENYEKILLCKDKIGLISKIWNSYKDFLEYLYDFAKLGINLSIILEFIENCIKFKNLDDLKKQTKILRKMLEYHDEKRIERFLEYMCRKRYRVYLNSPIIYEILKYNFKNWLEILKNMYSFDSYEKIREFLEGEKRRLLRFGFNFDF